MYDLYKEQAFVTDGATYYSEKKIPKWKPSLSQHFNILVSQGWPVSFYTNIFKSIGNNQHQRHSIFFNSLKAFH